MNERGTNRLHSDFVAGLLEVNHRSRVCGKFRLLALLHERGFRVPATIVCSFDAHKLYITNPSEALDIVRTRLSELLAESEKYSVRSCTSPEDSYDFSLSGRSKRNHNIKGIDAILEAVKNSWESKSIETATHDKRLDERLPLVSVMIQETPHVNLSGVAFTCNPVTGVDEVVVEAANQGLHSVSKRDSTPNRWVYKRGDWTQRPENQEDREKVIGEIVKTAEKIARAFGSSVALEWVFDGSQIHWLQIGLVSKIDIYSNRISREFLPGIIKPLVWSVNIPVVNSSWKKFFKELIGPMADEIDISSLARSFYYRAYFNMGVIGDIFDLLGVPRESLEILSGIEAQSEKPSRIRPSAKAVRYLPRILIFALKKLLYSKQIELFLRNKTSHYASLDRIDVNLLDVDECLATINELLKLNTESSYVVIATQLLNSLYNMILQRHLKRQGIDGNMAESGETSERLQSVDPRYYLSRLNSLYNKLPGDVAKRIKVMAYPNIIDDSSCYEFGTQLSLFVRRFGHLSDSGNDFSTSAWREDPHLIVNMITQYKPVIEPSRQASCQLAFDNSLKKSIFTKMLYARAAKYREYRTAVTFVYSFGYWLFRKYFLRIAEIWLSKGYIESKEDIFYLNLEEIRALTKEEVNYLELRKRIIKRKAEVEMYRDITLPDIIYGDLPENALVTTGASKEFSGVPTSRGHYVGPARLVRSVRDFDKIRQGDVLVIPYSDISWTPVFSKARAVVSESGGILSHCSVVAREYSIPAVVSVKGALTIKEGARIAVDGYKGTVLVLTE